MTDAVKLCKCHLNVFNFCVGVLYRIVYYRSKAVLFCEKSNLRESKPCMVRNYNKNISRRLFCTQGMRKLIPFELSFFWSCFVRLRSTNLKRCHAPIRPAQMAFGDDNIALVYRVSPGLLQVP